MSVQLGPPQFIAQQWSINFKSPETKEINSGDLKFFHKNAHISLNIHVSDSIMHTKTEVYSGVTLILIKDTDLSLLVSIWTKRRKMLHGFMCSEVGFY